MIAAEYEERCREPSDIRDWLPTLFGFATYYTDPVILELGVRSGNSTAAFLAGVDKVGGHVWSMDIHPPNVPGEWFDHPRWTFIQADDVRPPALLPALFDIVFVDTSHAYEHTMAELRLYVPRVRAGGVMLFHDTELLAPEGVGEQPPFPVAKALDDFCSEHRQYRWANNSGCYGLGVMPFPKGAA